MSKLNYLSVNDLFKENISTITEADIPQCGRYFDREKRIKYLSLERIIDSIGERSTKAQGLKVILTSLEKLRKSTDHKIYILKDETGKLGSGEAIGILKIGPKRLFLHDKQRQSVIVTPMCVLDFYVLESKQRQGFGKNLFDFMLQDQKLAPHELAIDGPSPSMLAFLTKHYNFTDIVKHSNNFAVCEKFFESANAGPTQKEEAPGPTARPPLKKWKSEMAYVVHGKPSLCSPDLIASPPQEDPTKRPTLKKWSSEAGAVIHGGTFSSVLSRK